MQFFYQPLNHLRPIRSWAAAHQARVMLDADSFQLRIAAGGCEATLHPRFAIRANGRLAYTHRPESGGFVGWLPYELKQWDVATDKLLFKARCVEMDIPTPTWGDRPLAGVDCLVKARRGSFGRGISGPFRANDPEVPQVLDSGCFFEAFKFGRAAKAWYWRDTVLAVEVLEPPFVVGDGTRSIQALLAQARGSFDRSYDAQGASSMLAWQGLTAGDVPKAGRKVWLGFKYVTDYDAVVLNDRDVLPTVPLAVTEQFTRAGANWQAMIPIQHAASSVYTVDAVIDAAGTAWFLEMNCHPMVHPKVYATMLTDLLAPAPATKEQR